MSVAWFIYLATVSESVGVLCASGFVLGAIAFALLWCAEMFEWYDDEKELGRVKAARRPLRWPVCICLVLSVFLPTKNTLYAIAAVEVSQQIINNPVVDDVAKDAGKAVQKWIHKQLDEKDGK